MSYTEITEIQYLQHQDRCSYVGMVVLLDGGRKNFLERFHNTLKEIPLNEETKNLVIYDIPELKSEKNLQIYLLKKICLRTRVLLPFGVFSVKNIGENPNNVKDFFDEKGYFILDMDHQDLLCEKLQKSFVECVGIVIAKDMKSFKDVFHRSSEYVTAKTISISMILDAFSSQKSLIDFFEKISESSGVIQIRIIKEIRVREKELTN